MKIIKKIFDYIISLILTVIVFYVLGYFRLIEPINSIIEYIITLGGVL